MAWTVVASGFHNDTFSYCIAIPTRSIDNHLYFQDNYGQEIPAFNCESTRYLAEGEDCYGWSLQASYDARRYRHQCYNTFCVDAPWALLSEYYESHTDEYYTRFYNGIVVSSAQYPQKVQHEDGTFTEVGALTYTAPNIFSISTTIHVSVDLGDIRVYSPAVVFAYESAHATVFSEFEWSLNNSVDVVAQIYITTQVQAPLFVSLYDYSARNYDGYMDVFEYGMSDLCMNRPGGYYLDNTDEPCRQEWLVTLVPEFDDCGIDAILDLLFTFDCDPAFVDQLGECPFTHDVDNRVNFEFDFSTDDWCDVLDIDIAPPQAYIDSYKNSQCDKSDDFLNTQRSFFEVNLEGNDYLTISSSRLHGLHIATTCGPDYGQAAWFMLDTNRTTLADQIGLYVDNAPLSSCAYTTPANTVRFEFDLSSAFFEPPKKGNCQFVVWAVIEMEYVGFEKDGSSSRLLSVELNEDFVDASPINMGSIKMEVSYSFIEQSAASMLSVSFATLLLAVLPAALL